MENRILTDTEQQDVCNSSKYYVYIEPHTVSKESNLTIFHAGRTFFFRDEEECNEFIEWLYNKGFEFQAEKYYNKKVNK